MATNSPIKLKKWKAKIDENDQGLAESFSFANPTNEWLPNHWDTKDKIFGSLRENENSMQISDSSDDPEFKQLEQLVSSYINE